VAEEFSVCIAETNFVVESLVLFDVPIRRLIEAVIGVMMSVRVFISASQVLAMLIHELYRSVKTRDNERRIRDGCGGHGHSSHWPSHWPSHWHSRTHWHSRGAHGHSRTHWHTRGHTRGHTGHHAWSRHCGCGGLLGTVWGWGTIRSSIRCSSGIWINTRSTIRSRWCTV